MSNIAAEQRNVLRRLHSLARALDGLSESRADADYLARARVLREILSIWAGVLAAETVMTPALVHQQAAL